MIRFDYDSIMKRYNVLVPFTLAGETSETTVASISEDNRLTTHRELKISLVRQILLAWDEYEYQRTRELQSMLDSQECKHLMNPETCISCEEEDSNKPTFH